MEMQEEKKLGWGERAIYSIGPADFEVFFRTPNEQVEKDLDILSYPDTWGLARDQTSIP